MPIENVLASVAVNDLNAAVDWYERLFGTAARRSTPDLAEWEFDGGGWLQVYELAERAGTGSFTVSVSDIDEQLTALAELGIDAGEPTDGETVKTLMMVDPDGNHIAFAESIDR